MARIIQVGAGSGGMPVLDMLARDPAITAITLIEPDVYKPHNLERHLFPQSEIGEPKAEAAARWLRDRRPDLGVRILAVDLLDPHAQADIEQAVAEADIGVCAADNETAKYHWDALMRRHEKPWTLGEVLSGGIGGFVHAFRPGAACYGCVASHLQRSVKVQEEKTPDYTQPGGPAPEVTIPASMASIHAIASLHALLTLDLAHDPATRGPGFTSMLFTLRRVPGIFEEPYRPYRFQIARAETCLICRAPPSTTGTAPSEALDAALDEALARLGDA